MTIVSKIKPIIAETLQELYGWTGKPEDLTINRTNAEFEGDYTLVLFGFIKSLKKSPELLGNEIGSRLTERYPNLFHSYNVIKGFLNLVIADAFWLDFIQHSHTDSRFGYQPSNGRKVIVEYSSPNTNKPIHLGHLRNNFLGWSVAEIMKANGYDVFKTCVVNDRGIHICKSMIAWQLFANGATPESAGIKGDHFVGDYYVRFSDEYKRQIDELVAGGMDKKEAEKEAPIMKATQQMLLDWEAGKPEVMELWRTMNSWVYEGFAVTYKRIGSDFDKWYYESETYLPGKRFVEEGVKDGVFYRKEDGSTWIDLTAEGLDEKLVLRKDGTSVYITQDLGLAEEKYRDFPYDQSIYVIADEQNYHMKVLKFILQKLKKPYADGIFHLSYGMVELPSGRMKSREGTVVDADDLLDEMHRQAQLKTEEQGKVKTQHFSETELQSLYEMIGTGGIKFYLLRVDPKKKMVFNPEESIDLQGFTATFIQYAHARSRSILRDAAPAGTALPAEALLPAEKDLALILEQFPAVLQQAGEEHNPSLVAIYAFNVAQLLNSFYGKHKVLKAESETKKELRLQLIATTAHVLKTAMALLGVQVPERM